VIDDPQPPAAEPDRPRSARERLSELAAQAALATEGVVGLYPSPVDVARPGATGVLCAERADGRYELRVQLAVKPVALRELGDRVRTAVAAAAAGDGLGDRLGPVDVYIRDIVPPGEVPA